MTTFDGVTFESGRSKAASAMSAAAAKDASAGSV